MLELGLYRHFKGNEYEVTAIAKHSETGEEMVVYRAVANPEEFWIRPLTMWNETVVRDGKEYQRFSKI